MPLPRASNPMMCSREVNTTRPKAIMPSERDGRNASDKTTSHNYAPSAFCREPEGKGIRKEHFVAAMRRLFASGKLHVEDYGRPSRPLSRLKLGRKGDSRDG
jgi:hypothetical protein